jgi:hypothetical protein
MIWMSWRQFRGQAITAGAILVVLAIALGITGTGLASDYHGAGLNSCHLSCATDATNFLNSIRGSGYQTLFDGGIVVMYLVPALIGLFWGAPLIARELETGTFRLAWTQSLTRRRWLAVKIGLLGLASMAAAGLLSLMVTWWFSPLDRMNQNEFTPGMFDVRGIAPIGYAAFAFALGVTAGVLIRRTVPAMAAVVLPYIAARLAVTYWIRPNLMAPARMTAPLSLGGSGAIAGGRVNPPGLGAPNPADWVLSSNTVNAAGRVIGQNGGISGPNGIQGIGFQPGPNGVWLAGVGRCPNIPAGTPIGPGSKLSTSGALQTCIDKLGLHQELIYQPISRFWAFQWCELGMFLAAAVLLAGFCFWWVRRRLA